MDFSVFDTQGRRKYLNRTEVRRFLEQASRCDDPTYSFCWLMTETGCRISEALALTRGNIDLGSRLVVIECLKKRRKGVFRTVPLSSELAAFLKQIYDLQGTSAKHEAAERLWPWTRLTGYRKIRKVMAFAGLSGLHATPKGLRHGYGVAAISAGIPLNLVQSWLGHADIATTAIYAAVTGPEERAIASRLWTYYAPSGG
ncbi:site-specific integrase [Sphingomonas sp. AP4-R1]|uniref:tyrosine-type recombinase/integrase n=1 Tax=Sphingomonas sp. AP4-R1 TaxID=2735134 RepID=UPI001493361E|nr:site-specific integrase [Sphingomonas sp. AP4-R1]QJU56998.1 site-specific integrase [Sphingomonas sp. AP4-R1]